MFQEQDRPDQPYRVVMHRDGRVRHVRRLRRAPHYFFLDPRPDGARVLIVIGPDNDGAIECANAVRAELIEAGLWPDHQPESAG